MTAQPVPVTPTDHCDVCERVNRRCRFGDVHGLCSCWRGQPCPRPGKRARLYTDDARSDDRYTDPDDYRVQEDADRLAMHLVSDPGIVWHGGMRHRIIGTDDGIECFACGMAADGAAWQELIPDCEGSDGGDHHWIGAYASDGTPRNECAYGDAWVGPYGGEEHAGGRCRRA